MTGNNVIANLTEENSLLKQEVSGLKQENSLLKQEVSGLKHENSLLKQEIAGLNKKISCLMKEISGLKDRNSPFTNEEKEEKENLYAQIRNLKEQNEASKTFIKVFMNRLDQIEEHNKRLMKKEDKLNFFLQAYPFSFTSSFRNIISFPKRGINFFFFFDYFSNFIIFCF